MKYSVSVIIPVFKVERFIERCCRYLFEQTLESAEFIFVDDCSPDNSVSIINKIVEEYPERKYDVQIVKHEINKGLPSARNSGLKIASGEYIFHCDSDDWLEKNALSLLYEEAIEKNVDAVWCDWYLSFKNNERYMSQRPEQEDIISGLECVKLMLDGKIRYNVWNKLVKRELYKTNEIQFPDGYGMGEDMTMIKVLAFADKVSYLPIALYHYIRLNEEAFTQNTTEQHLKQIQYNVNDIVSFLNNRYEKEDTEKYIQFFKLNTKLPFLISNDTESYKRWLEWYPEANAYIDLNPMFSTRTKFIQKAAMKHQFWILKLYYNLVIRFIYGVIYK
ncbi:glycosyltransferase family 2 protein [Elizabethkingia anophelis]|uniref:glycosyltransferase family 2 protein n=1 Tax=Elizabethkingia anophelis TaxID=1117645 RepID=UPI0021A7F187|nr:glycosyltransferase family 2 protein [Elizabethkingia anophelis]MDV3897850.1 glycosyl transferase family A [Elizabethkingia anophelis]MDV3926660.1 glycosyl transferase family A [Elizabethkingia anophelis]MDV4025682.1 glycosyl transferase family A [Elizabethkingia anophelis]